MRRPSAARWRRTRARVARSRPCSSWPSVALAGRWNRPSPTLPGACVNNDGGGICHSLSIAQHPERFEELFATPHGLDLEGAARLCGAEFVRVSDGRALRSALQRPATGLRIVEARTDRAANV